MIRLSDRVQALRPSATFAIKAAAAALRAAGEDVLDLSMGEPDGLPPEEAPIAAIEAVRAGRNTYSPVAGLPELRSAVAESYEVHGLDYGPANVLVTMGAKQALYNLLHALLGPSDEVIVFSPYWVSYLSQIELTGATAVVVRTRPEDGFQPDLDAIEVAISERTRVILLNSPSNPGGCVIEPNRLAGIDRLAQGHDLVVISDEIYDAMTYDGVVSTCFATVSDSAPGRTVIVNAISKTYAMTGWRVGWMVGPESIVKACTKLQGHSTSGVCPINQLAALAAITAPREFFVPVRAALRRRRDLLAIGLAAIPGFELGPTAQGAFYLFPRIDALFGRTSPTGRVLRSGLDVADWLIHEGGIAVVPGEAFGEGRCIRISYAVGVEVLEAGVSRIEAAVRALR